MVNSFYLDDDDDFVDDDGDVVDALDQCRM